MISARVATTRSFNSGKIVKKTRSVTHTLIHVRVFITVGADVIQFVCREWLNNPFGNAIFLIHNDSSLNFLI